MTYDAAVGLSGGVDSALAAALLLREGRRVCCVYLDNGVGDPGPARETAAALGCPLEIVSMGEELEREVCAPFAAEYLAGRTPSPCARCNERVKFPLLLAAADRMGAPIVATGHYARSEGGGLYRGKAPNDQSYLLGRLRREQLERVVFPLGGMNKEETRRLAEELGLRAAGWPDSMELCFIPDDDYGSWLAARGETPGPGNFTDKEGRVLGQHRGYWRYTLGQGRGLGVSGPHKYYVSAILPEENRVVLSDGSDLGRTELRCGEMNWLMPIGGPTRLTGRFRHSKDETGCVVTPMEDGTAWARTDRPVRAPAPGQLAVFYDGERVAGSGWILS